MLALWSNTLLCWVLQRPPYRIIRQEWLVGSPGWPLKRGQSWCKLCQLRGVSNVCLAGSHFLSKEVPKSTIAGWVSLPCLHSRREETRSLSTDIQHVSTNHQITSATHKATLKTKINPPSHQTLFFFFKKKGRHLSKVQCDMQCDEDATRDMNNKLSNRKGCLFLIRSLNESLDVPVAVLCARGSTFGSYG